MGRKAKTNTSTTDVSLENEHLELQHAREVICDRLDRFKQFLDVRRDEIFQIEIRLKSVQEDFSEFDKIQTRLEYLLPEEKEFRLHTESEFYMLIATAKQLINQHQKKEQMAEKLATSQVPSALGPSASIQIPSAVARLPDLGLPSFYGKYETWYSFKDIFDSVVHNRTDLSDIDKFLYLKICCKADALKLIDSLDVTASNYSIALNLLQKRYENKRAILNHHINHLLFNLPQVSRESASQLRSLIDSLHQHISALRKLNLPVDHWDQLLIPIVLRKLDDRTKREWESKQVDNDLPTLQNLIDILTKKCFTLEALNSDLSRLPTQQKATHRKYDYERSGARCNFVQSANSRNKLNCQFCHGDHFIYFCQPFANLPLSEKYKIIRENKLCSNCLRTGHLKFDCKSSGCKKCHYKHNTILHDSKIKIDDSQYEIKPIYLLSEEEMKKLKNMMQVKINL